MPLEKPLHLIEWEHSNAVRAYAEADQAWRQAQGALAEAEAKRRYEAAYTRVVAAVEALHDVPLAIREDSEAPARALLFDLFDTLVYRSVERRPYKQMIAWARDAGLETGGAARHVMTSPLDLEDALHTFGWNPPTTLRRKWAEDLAEELEGIRPFTESAEVLEILAARGLSLALCSNLALPYAAALHCLPPVFRATVWSFEVNALKPEAAIYGHAVAAVGAPDYACLFIGDRENEDVKGPLAVGICARRIDRSQGKDLRDLLQDYLAATE